MQKTSLVKFNPDPTVSGSWLFLYGLLAKRESQLLSSDRIQQVYQTKEADGRLAILRDANYQADNLPEAIAGSFMEDLDLLNSAIGDPDFYSFILLDHDRHNLRALLRLALTAKDTLAEKTINALLQGPYMVEPKSILDQINQEFKSSLTGKQTDSNLCDYTICPEWMQEVVHQARLDFAEYYDLGRLDNLVEKAYWQEALRLSQKLESSWLKGLILDRVDYKNLEILLRCRSLGLSENYFKNQLINLGDLSEEGWLDLFHLKSEELVQALALTKFEDFGPYVKAYADLGQAANFSQLVDRKIIERLAETKTLGPGLDKTMAYVLSRQLERKNLRVAEAALSNNFSDARKNQLMRPGF